MSLDTILNIMAKHGLDCNEIMLLYLTFISQSECGNVEQNRVYFDKWYKAGGNKMLLQLFNSLKEKGVIIKNYCPDSYIPDEVELNKTFVKSYFKLTGELGKELYNAYPSYMNINGRNVFLKNHIKKFLNVEDVYFWYAKTIGHSIEYHKFILDTLAWAKEHNLITFSLLEFIGSQKWYDLDEMRKNGIQNQASTMDVFETAN